MKSVPRLTDKITITVERDDYVITRLVDPALIKYGVISIMDKVLEEAIAQLDEVES